MGKFVKSSVVVLPFPFSDLSGHKRRPAIVVAELRGDDLILCQITSQALKDHYAITLNDSDFVSGSLNQQSYVRPNRIFTADTKIIFYEIGKIQEEKLKEIRLKISKIIDSN